MAQCDPPDRQHPLLYGWRRQRRSRAVGLCLAQPVSRPYLVAPDRADRSHLLAIGIGLNLAALVYYKYTVFAWNVLSETALSFADVSLGSAPQIVLPIGIS